MLSSSKFEVRSSGCAAACSRQAESLSILAAEDVVGRDVFGAPLPGGYELSGLLLFTLFFLGLPLVSVRDEHIRVSLLDRVLTDRFRVLIASLFTLAASVALLVCSAYVAVAIWLMHRLWAHPDAMKERSAALA